LLKNAGIFFGAIRLFSAFYILIFHFWRFCLQNVIKLHFFIKLFAYVKKKQYLCIEFEEGEK